MKKIVYIVPKLARTGVTNVLVNLVVQLVGRYDLTIVVMKKWDAADSIQPELEKAGIKTLYLSQTNITRKIVELRRILRDVNPDIVHSLAFKSDLVCLFVSGEWPVVSTAHNIPFNDFSNVYGKWIGSLMVRAQTFAYRRFTKVAAVSNAVSDDWQQRNVNTTVIHNGIRALQLKVREKAENSGIMHLVWTGRISKRKNLETILKAVRLVKNIHLIIVGDGVLYTELRDKYQDATIKFVGRKEDVSPYLETADCFVSASYSEGLPMAAIEAMSHNLKMILSDIPQHRELDVNSDEGFVFFSTENVEELKDALVKTKNSGGVSHVREGFLEHFTSAVMADKYSGMYNQIVRENEK